MTNLQFTPNGTYNGYIRWDATDGVNTYSIVWNSEGYWEMLGWSVGDLRSYSSPNITPLDGWKLYNTRITGTFDVIQGDCIIPTPTPTNTPTPTSTSEPIPTPTPTPTQEVLINPILIGKYLNKYKGIDGKNIAKAMNNSAKNQFEKVKIYQWKEMNNLLHWLG